MKKICEHDECDNLAGAGTSHEGKGTCTLHESKTLEEITAVIKAPPKNISESAISATVASGSLDPIITELQDISVVVKGLLEEWQVDNTYKDDNFGKFDKTIQNFIKVMNSLEKAINDKNVLEIRLRELKREEQDWKIAYYIIELLMQEDPILAEKLMVKLRRRHGSYDDPR